MAALKRIYTIVLGGTSLTNGRYSTSWDRDLQKALEQVVNRPVRIINLGKGSQTSTSWGVPIIPQVVAQQPDLFLTELYAINNCAMGVTRAQANANSDLIIGGVQTGSPRTKICVQTMSSATSDDTLRTTLSQYYGDEVAKAQQWGVDCLNHFLDWPNPLPAGDVLLDPLTGLPLEPHPNVASVRQYFFPKTLAYITPLILTAP